ncbi:precorrin-3B synthase [Streptomyces sp. NPDC000594]|uniref:precorrin-3B synthase n=1 Tax=Streptomyces sp. NPDC000594 TaxID=3154261 RepID=UPI003330723D
MSTTGATPFTSPDAPLLDRGAGDDPVRDGGDACPGALRLHRADDGALARIRLPGGVLDAAGADALARAAGELGDGVLHLTSRGNVQLRGMRDGCGATLARLLDGAGLLPSPRHERIRNVVASPLSGLDGRGRADVGPWLRELDGLLCAGGAVGALSGRFLFALDDGRGDVGALGADVTVTAAVEDGWALLRLGGGGGALRIRGERAARAAVTAAEVFLAAVREVALPGAPVQGAALPGAPVRDAALPGAPVREVPVRGAAVRDAAARGLWRVADLGGQEDALLREVALRLAALGAEAHEVPAPAVVPDPADGPPPGVVPGPDPGRVALSVRAPLGLLTGAQWRALTDCARADGRGELRLTPWRGIVVPAVAAGRAADRLAALAATGLVTGADSPWWGVGACAGRPGCAKSLADVRADATALVALTPTGDRGRGALPVYWSGCGRGCGRPPGDRIDVVAESTGYRVDEVRAGRPRTRSRVDHSAGPGELAAAVRSARAPETPQGPAGADPAPCPPPTTPADP